MHRRHLQQGVNSPPRSQQLVRQQVSASAASKLSAEDPHTGPHNQQMVPAAELEVARSSDTLNDDRMVYERLVVSWSQYGVSDDNAGSPQAKRRRYDGTGKCDSLTLRDPAVEDFAVAAWW